MQIFLDSVFSKSYNLIFAENGEQGVEMAIANKPDLIISDVMMPKLNGIEMSKILHAKKYTHHIPIILMSAHNQENTKINSLKSGAIEYIKKPFDIQELKVKVENIIVRSENLLNKYKTDSIANPDVSEIDSADILFMQNLMKQIQLNIDNSNFKLEDLAHTMNMSYSSIYRKCHSNTGKTLVNFMRWIRIKNATLLILKHGNGISESAYQSGFNSPKYFTKCFKNEFGMSPNQFRKEAQNHGIEKTLEKYKIEFEV
jgi:YesN/AraC family two-component response regulator